MSEPLVCLTLALLAPTTSSPAPAPRLAEEQPRVLVVGTYHMGNPGLDMVNPEADDVLQEHRQVEIEELVEKLLRFEPTKVAVEVLPSQEAAINGRFRAYLDGTAEARRDEVYQVAFRLAAAMGHDGLHGVDFQQPMPMETLFEAAQEHQPAIAYELHRRMGEIEEMFGPLMKRPVVEILREMNSARADEEHDVYLLMAQVGSESDPVGANAVAAWYSRNLQIFGNVARLAEASDERILVLIGAGHGTLLREFVRQAPNLELADTLEYLR